MTMLVELRSHGLDILDRREILKYFKQQNSMVILVI